MLLILKVGAIFGKFYAHVQHGHSGGGAWAPPPQPVHVHVHGGAGLGGVGHDAYTGYSQAYSSWEPGPYGPSPHDDSYNYYKG